MARERKDRRWARFLSKKLVDEVLSINPKDILLESDNKTYIIVTIETEHGMGVGSAICSVLDDFDFKEGKNKAFGRAVAALKNKNNSMGIRKSFEEFPSTWTKAQIMRVMNFRKTVLGSKVGKFFSHKSLFIPSFAT